MKKISLAAIALSFIAFTSSAQDMKMKDDKMKMKEPM